MDDTQRAVRQERNNEAEVEIPPEMGVSGFAGFLQMKSGLTVCERRSNIRFWRKKRGNVPKIAEYIQNQLKEDVLSDQLTSDLSAPFTGSKQQNASAGALQAVSVTGGMRRRPSCGEHPVGRTGISLYSGRIKKV